MNLHSRERALTVALHWPRFGPYHLARLRAAKALLDHSGFQVVGLEIASRDDLYLWREETAGHVAKETIFPGRSYDDISSGEMCRGIFKALSKIDPDVVATNGYSSLDALCMVLWCRLHACPVILMSESKADDAPRVWWKEWFKRLVIRQFSAALCGGRLHRSYLEQMGVSKEDIFEGYDTVDNDFFAQGAERVRRAPEMYRTLPGLEDPAPFFLASARFVRRKNIDGLLRAYGDYRRRLGCSGDGQKAWRLVVLGDGVERDTLKRLVAAEGIEGVSFPGFRQIEELPAYYGLAGVFVHAAHQEQWGLVVNEAMAAALPVLVSSRCGCVPDLVCEGVNGFTFASDDIAGLAELMARVSSGQVDLRAMGAAARERIQAWGPQRFAQGLHGAVQAALGRHITVANRFTAQEKAS